MARRHPHGIPPVKCHATAKSTGERCEQWAVVGGTVCYHHGANGNVKRNATTRVTLAQLIEQNPRHPWEVIIDATHTLDAITREFRAEVLAGETIGVGQLDRLIELSRTTHHLASTAISTRAAENVSLTFTRHLEVEGQLVGTALGAAIDGLGLTEPWRRYALELAHWTLLGEGDHERGDQPQPPEEPIVREYDVGPRSNAPAIEAVPSTPVPCDVAGLGDDALRDLGGRVLDELERRGVDG